MITETKIDVRYPDCDQMGIVHHAVYPIWYEMGRMDFFAACGCDFLRSRGFNVDPAMVNLELSYAAPVRYPQTVTLKTRCVLLEGKKIAFRYEIYAGGDRPNAQARSFHIWVRDGKSVDIEREVPEMFAAYRGAVEPVSHEERGCM